MKKNLLLLFTLYLSISALVIHAAPGDIDQTFRTGGFALSAFGGTAYATALQLDGKIILVGRAENGFTVVRYQSDGTPDISFGINGKVTTNVEGDNEIPFDVAVQTDGKIVVVGQFQIGTGFDYDFGIIRYNSDGSLDNTFGTGGRVSTAIGDREDVARTVIIQPDGKIFVGGSAYFVGNTAAGRFAVVRYNVDGTLDTTFDSDGKAVVQQNGFGDMALETSGKIIVGSSNGFGSSSNFVISRLNANGQLDITFGNQGSVITNFQTGASSISSVAVQSDGKIIAAGNGFGVSGQNLDFALARYNTDGSLDAAFDGDGRVTTALGNQDDYINEIVLQPNGKIIAAGYAITSGASNKMAFARYNIDGSLDAIFGNNGKFSIQIFPGRDYAQDIELQPNGEIVVGGSVGGAPSRFAVFRFTATGAPDQSFNSGPAGRAIATEGEVNRASDVIVLPDGKIVAAGATSNSLLLDFSIAKFNADGTADTTFGNGGKVVTSVSSSIDGASAVAYQPDGKIIAAGYSGTPGITDVALVRYNADGSLDTTFDTDGVVVLSRSGSTEYASDVVVQPDGKIVIGGSTNISGSSEDFFLARFNANGSLDATFGANGTVTTGIGSGSDFAKSLELQTDGRLVAAGTSRTGSNGDFAVVRYNSNGFLDTTFGINGKVVTSFGVGNDDGNGTALQADGKIVVVGVSTIETNSNFALIRYNPDGSLDDSFGTGGKTITSLDSSSSAEDVKIQQNGKIVVVGLKYLGQSSDIVVIRYNSTGLPDAAFGVGGIVLTDLDNRRDWATAVALQGNEKLIVAGGSYDDSGSQIKSNLFVIRYLANNETLFDFDGDGKADISVFRPDNGAWYLQQSTAGFAGLAFGLATDKIVPADYDGDGKTDVAVVRSGIWYLQRSTLGFTGIAFGDGSDIPVPADYDGDGKSDLAVFRPSNGVWYIQRSQLGFTGIAFGQTGDKPVPADFDGDGKADIAVNRNGVWYIQRSQLGFTGIQFGDSNDKLVPADYDGDGKADVAVFRPSNGVWYLLRSTAGFTGITFGIGTDVPAAADYDGDGKTDLAVFRDGIWYLNRTTAGFTGVTFGAATDKPIPNAFVQ